MTPASKEFKGVLAGARARREQELWVGTAALLGVMAGVVLWFLAVALLPWGLGHRMAASLVGGDRWEAGSVLMNEANPAAWEKVVRLNKACGDNPVALCEAAMVLRTIPPIAPIQPAPETAKPAPPVAAPAPVPSPSSGRAGAGR